jgi:long-subunit acyl-CoA synthetase (AMP-forming)
VTGGAEQADRILGASIPAVLDERLARWRDYPVARELQPGAEPNVISADEYRSRITALAGTLRAEGIGERTLVSLFLENSIDHLVMLFALFEIGAIPVIAKLEYRSLELDEIFANADPAAVVTEEHHLPVLAPYLEGRTIISRGDRGFRMTQRGEAGTTAADLPDGTASINYTYRGLGYPLGAIVSHAQYLHGARIIQDGVYGLPGQSMLFSIPMSHIFTLVGCVIAPLLYGLTAVIARTIHPRAIFDYFDTYGIEHVVSIPEIYRLLHRSRPAQRTFPALRTFLSGGSFLGPEEHARIGAAFPADLCHGYGLTEFTPVSASRRGRVRTGTCGPLSDGVECRIDADDGEILFRTPTMSPGYYRRPAESRDACPDGWFRTGDVGRLESGNLVFSREKKRTCKVNGVMVDLAEVERAIRTHPRVSEAHVAFRDGMVRAEIGVSGGDDSEEIQQELRTYLEERIAAYKVPRRFDRL